MDDFKPEDDMKADRNDRRAGRSVSLPSVMPIRRSILTMLILMPMKAVRRAGKARREREEEEFEELDAQDEEMLEEQPVERRPRKRKSAGQTGLPPVHHDGCGDSGAAAVDRGIGSALKSPSSSSQQTASGEKSINLSTTSPPACLLPADRLPPQQHLTAGRNGTACCREPDAGQAAAAPQGQQRIEVQGDLNNALTQQQGQLDGAVANSTLPTEPATVAPIRNGANGTAAPRRRPSVRQQRPASG